MKLRRVQIDGFKALDELDIVVAEDQSFLIGVNGAGKSTILQALAFVRAFSEGRCMEFFAERNWQIADVRPRIRVRSQRPTTRTNPRTVPTKNLSVALTFSDGPVRLYWTFTWGYVATVLLEETIWIRSNRNESPRSFINYVRPTKSNVEVSDQIKLEDLRFPGSILSVIPPERLAAGADLELIRGVVRWAAGITSLELLSPVAMRRSVRGTAKDIGPRGERLSAFIAALPQSKKAELVERVSKFYPLAQLETVRKNAGWIDMKMLEAYDGIGRINPAHMSDGFMRILALCAIPEFSDDVSLILLDEVEDGIEPHVMPQLINFITAATSCQFVMTSHSPLLVNYFGLNDVSFLTRLPDGRTILAPARDLDLFNKGSDLFGVGEIWINASPEAISQAVSRYFSRKSNRQVVEQDEVGRVNSLMDGR